MAEYIDKEAAIEALCSNCYASGYPDLNTRMEKCQYKSGNYGGCQEYEDLIALPAADVRENIRGEWIKMDMHRGMENYKCSVCRSECYVPKVMGEPMFPLCPYCGAQMDVPDTDVGKM